MCHNKTSVSEGNVAQATTETVPTSDGDLPVLRFAAADESAPTVLLATDIYGTNDFYRFLGSRLANAGLTTLIPDLFFRVGPAEDDGRDAALERRARLDDPLALADLTATRTALVPAGRSYGLLGFCLGGSLALLAAADDPNAVTVSYYGFPRGAPGARVAAEEPIGAASRITGAVLGIWGAEDYIDKDDIETLRAALDAGPADYQHVIYDGVGHAFLGGLTEGGPSSVAAQDAWRRTTEFFGLRLGSQAGTRS
jgi:carboxymethylenebutenolidase